MNLYYRVLSSPILPGRKVSDTSKVFDKDEWVSKFPNVYRYPLINDILADTSMSKIDIQSYLLANTDDNELM